jgi:hypothetical protein
VTGPSPGHAWRQARGQATEALTAQAERAAPLPQVPNPGTFDDEDGEIARLEAQAEADPETRGQLLQHLHVGVPPAPPALAGVGRGWP